MTILNNFMFSVLVIAIKNETGEPSSNSSHSYL